jgi:hypothetical protein
VAATFEITALIPTQELTPANKILEVMEASGTTIPHGVNFTVTVPKTTNWKAALLEAAAAEAAELESVFEA